MKDIIKDAIQRFKNLWKRNIKRLVTERNNLLKSYYFDSEKNDLVLRYIEFEVVDTLNLRNLNAQNVLFNKELELMKQYTYKYLSMSQNLKNSNQIISYHIVIECCQV